ncbi:MAG: hypothetical protein NW201_07915 [Gemmatimonadales bacterium]|nr:hypothetical protein [Gemmatimonadales bacterium]
MPIERLFRRAAPRPVIHVGNLPFQQGRTWPAVLGSVLLHVLLAALGVGVFFDRPDKELQPAPPPREVEMVYLPPPPGQRPKPLPPIPPPQPPAPDAETAPTPPEPLRQQVAAATPPRLPQPQLGLFKAPPAPKPEGDPRPEPEPNALPDETPRDGEGDPAEAPPEPGAEQQSEQPAPSEAPPNAPLPEPKPEDATSLAPKPEVARAAPTMEEEAQRIFGRKRSAGAEYGEQQVSVRPFSVPGQGGGTECQPMAPIPRDANGKAPMGLAVGRILREDNGLPLAGAHLQMVGTTFTAFTDDDGNYRFYYDISLVENCRTQFVRVTAPGYQSRMLVLIVGEDVRSEDVALRRR